MRAWEFSRELRHTGCEDTFQIRARKKLAPSITMAAKITMTSKYLGNRATISTSRREPTIFKHRSPTCLQGRTVCPAVAYFHATPRIGGWVDGRVTYAHVTHNFQALLCVGRPWQFFMQGRDLAYSDAFAITHEVTIWHIRMPFCVDAQVHDLGA